MAANIAYTFERTENRYELEQASGHLIEVRKNDEFIGYVGIDELVEE